MMDRESPLFQTFLRSYLECALWSSTDQSTPQGGDPMDRHYGPEDITDKAEEEAVQECLDFINMEWNGRTVESMLDEVDGDYSQHGHDFWLTRNHHGTGFWDRGYGPIGRILSAAAHSFGEKHPIPLNEDEWQWS